MSLSLLWVQNKLSSDKWQGSPQGQQLPRGSVQVDGLSLEKVRGSKFDAITESEELEVLRNEWRYCSGRDRGSKYLGKWERQGQSQLPHTPRGTLPGLWGKFGERHEQEVGGAVALPCFGRLCDIPVSSGRSHRGCLWEEVGTAAFYDRRKLLPGSWSYSLVLYLKWWIMPHPRSQQTGARSKQSCCSHWASVSSALNGKGNIYSPAW